MKTIIYIPLLIILVFLETITNRLAFELFFSNSLILEFAIALIVGSLMIGGAHIAGGVMSRAFYKNIEQNFTASFIKTIIIFLLAFFVMWILAQMRQVHIDFVTDNSTVSNDNSGGLVGAFLRLDLSIEGYVHLIANISLFTIAFIASFFRHKQTQ